MYIYIYENTDNNTNNTTLRADITRTDRMLVGSSLVSNL